MSTHTPLLDNVKSQIRNLARIQSIQLSEAYEIISWAFYHCPNYQDLLRKINNPDNKPHWLELAKLNNSSSVRELSKLRKVLLKQDVVKRSLLTY